MTSKERIYATLNGLSRDRVAVTPIFMTWAAHYIGRRYRDFYLDGDVLVEGQLAVTRAFNVDQISAISDPWREASVYGVQFSYPENAVGKPVDTLIKSREDIEGLRYVEIEKGERTSQRIESVGKMASQLGDTHSVLGWIEGPLAEYADLRGLERALYDLVDAPEMFSESAEILVEKAIRFARAQVEAGADMIGIGDAAASVISPEMYSSLVLPMEKRLISAIHEAGGSVKMHICGNIINIVEHVARTGADIIDIDWMVPLDEARRLAGPDVCLCGNFDPSAVLLQGTAREVAEAAEKCIGLGGEKFILMPGCEVPPGTPEENIRAFCPCRGSKITEVLQC